MSEDDKTAVIEDIRRVAALLETDTITHSQYLAHGKFTEYQLWDGGDTWSQLCEWAGVSCDKTREPVSDEEYLQRLSIAVDELVNRYPKASERKKYGLNFSKEKFPNLSSFIEQAIDLGYVPDLRKRSSSEKPANQLEAEATFPLLAEL